MMVFVVNNKETNYIRVLKRFFGFRSIVVERYGTVILDLFLLPISYYCNII